MKESFSKIFVQIQINLTSSYYRKVYYSNKIARIRCQQYIMGYCHQYYTQINYCINLKKNIQCFKIMIPF